MKILLACLSLTLCTRIAYAQAAPLAGIDYAEIASSKSVPAKTASAEAATLINRVK